MNANQATMRVYGPLNDFVGRENKGNDFIVEFSGNPGIKDVIENAGIPHPEIDLILVNSVPVDFSFKLHSGDRISVYPFMNEFSRSFPDEIRLCTNHSEPYDFLIDVNLGKLIRYVRMVGFDTVPSGDIPDAEIAAEAKARNRILLTRDIGLLKHKVVKRGYWVREDIPLRQLSEVLVYFNLLNQLKPFSRCLICNNLIENVKKEEIIHRLDETASKYYEDFRICRICDKVYWKGPHYKRMMGWIKSLG